MTNYSVFAVVHTSGCFRPDLIELVMDEEHIFVHWFDEDGLIEHAEKYRYDEDGFSAWADVYNSGTGSTVTFGAATLGLLTVMRLSAWECSRLRQLAQAALESTLPELQ